MLACSWMRPSSIALGLVLASGCHKLFDLESVDRPGDGSTVIDGPTTDTTVVRLDVPTGACPIEPAVFDEDGDSIDDRCDACPTVPSDDSDTDADGLPNACDLDLGATGDQILLAATFAREGDLTNNFTNGGGAWSASFNGRVHLESGARIQTVQLFAATRIVVRVTGFTASTRVSEILIETVSASCKVIGADCSTGQLSSAMCVRLLPMMMSLNGGEISAATSTLVELDLKQVNATLLNCTMRANGAASVNEMLSLGVTAFTIGASSGSTVDLDSVVIYGAK